MLGLDELKKRFFPQFLTPEGTYQLTEIRENFMILAEKIDREIPDGREKSLALNALQEASMWAVKAICVNPENWRTDAEFQQTLSDFDRGFQAGLREAPEGLYVDRNAPKTEFEQKFDSDNLVGFDPDKDS